MGCCWRGAQVNTENGRHTHTTPRSEAQPKGGPPPTRPPPNNYRRTRRQRGRGDRIGDRRTPEQHPQSVRPTSEPTLKRQIGGGDSTERRGGASNEGSGLVWRSTYRRRADGPSSPKQSNKRRTLPSLAHTHARDSKGGQPRERAIPSLEAVKRRGESGCQARRTIESDSAIVVRSCSVLLSHTQI